MAAIGAAPSPNAAVAEKGFAPAAIVRYWDCKRASASVSAVLDEATVASTRRWTMGSCGGMLPSAGALGLLMDADKREREQQRLLFVAYEILKWRSCKGLASNLKTLFTPTHTNIHSFGCTGVYGVPLLFNAQCAMRRTGKNKRCASQTRPTELRGMESSCFHMNLDTYRNRSIHHALVVASSLNV